MIGSYTAGPHPIVVRFMKAVFHKRPPQARHTITLDVDVVLTYLRKLSPIKHLNLKDLTLKLTMLMVLTNAAGVQTILLPSVNTIQKSNSDFVLQIRNLLKQSRSGFDCSSFHLKDFPPYKRLFVYRVLKEYLRRIKPIRKTEA